MKSSKSTFSPARKCLVLPSRVARVAGRARVTQKVRVLNSPKNDQANPSPTQRRLPEIARMIAEGELPVPTDWPPERLQPLLDLVHVARRRRLAKFVARIVANDIRRQERREDH